MKALTDANLFDYDTYKENQYILFDKEIIATGPMSEFTGADTIYNCQNSLVLPGFVLGHAHIYSTFARGWLTPFNPNNFRQLLEQMWWKLDAGLNLEAIYHSALVSGMEYIKNGITTVIDHHASGKDILGSLTQLKSGLCDDMGLRGVFCFETSDRFSIDKCIEENLTFGAKKNHQYAGLFGMHASLTLSMDTLDSVAKASGSMPIHIHVAESIEDQIDSMSKYGKRVVERLDQYGLLRPGSILSHCIHLEDKELEILSEKDVFIALNPSSNMNNGVGLPNYKAMKDQGLKCILGNDGLGFNMARDMLNFVFAMNHREMDATAVSLQDLQQVLRNNYDYAERILGCALGRFEKGYKADFISVPYTPPTEMNEQNAMGHFVYGICDGFRPKNVWCNGEIRLMNYEVQANETLINESARKIANKLWEEVQ
jgi:cytosine/adenosine deaminase-related metal-dependent hydrolase